MRFSEKSFEVRFCSALTAASMPFNRNPQWFGMTQAEERINGIDTMLRTGGRLLIFQFKAKTNSKLKFEKEQWRNLDRIERRFRGSVHYVFPEAEEVAEAASVTCLLSSSWCCPPSSLGPAFNPGAQSVSLSLDPANSNMNKVRRRRVVPVQSICQLMGCYCPPHHAIFRDDVGNTWFLTRGGPYSPDDGAGDHIASAFAGGIPIEGDEPSRSDVPPIRSTRDFEELLGEQAESNLPPNLFGFFLPRA